MQAHQERLLRRLRAPAGAVHARAAQGEFTSLLDRPHPRARAARRSVLASVPRTQASTLTKRSNTWGSPDVESGDATVLANLFYGVVGELREIVRKGVRQELEPLSAELHLPVHCCQELAHLLWWPLWRAPVAACGEWALGATTTSGAWCWRGLWPWRLRRTADGDPEAARPGGGGGRF